MPVPEKLSETWSEATAMMDKGDSDLALEILRESWDLCENDSQKAKTLKLAVDAGTRL